MGIASGALRGGFAGVCAGLGALAICFCRENGVLGADIAEVGASFAGDGGGSAGAKLIGAGGASFRAETVNSSINSATF